MPTLKTILQNAVEDYFKSIETPITLKHLEQVCRFNLSDVAFTALNEVNSFYAEADKEPKAEEPINGIKQSVALKTLTKYAQNCLFNNTVSARYGNLSALFKDAKTYGYNFWFGTTEGLHETLPPYSENDKRIIIAYGFDKIKK